MDTFAGTFDVANNAVAIGKTSVASGLGATTMGFGASASAQGATAFGQGANASAKNAMAIGNAAVATVENSVALGANSTTTKQTDVKGDTVGGIDYADAGGTAGGVVSVGAGTGATRQIQSVAAGQVSETSTDAVNGSQLYATNQAIGVLSNSINQLSNQVTANRKEARAGVAAAMALTSAPMPSAPGKTSWAGNTATYKGEYSVGFSFAHRLNTNIPVALTAGVAFSPGTNNVGGRVGMTGEF